MTKVRVLVGTQKGGFVLSSDGRRRDWDVAGPLFGGWEVYHMAASPADPDRLYASQSTGWFGQVVQRSDDGGSTWQPVGNEFVYEGGTGTHQWYDGSPHPWEFARVWHLEASASDPDSVLAGWRTPPCSAPPTEAPPGRRSPLCAPTSRGRAGSRGRGAWRSTRCSWTRPTPTGCTWRSRRRGCSAPPTAGPPGSRPTTACALSSSPSPRRTSATASTASPGTRRAPTCCSCRSTGT